MLMIFSLKFNFESIVIPSKVTDESDILVISPIELYTNHSNTFHVSCVRLVNILSKFIPLE